MLIYSRIATPPRHRLYGKDGILRQRRGLRRLLGEVVAPCSGGSEGFSSQSAAARGQYRDVYLNGGLWVYLKGF